MKHNLVPTVLALALISAFSSQSIAKSLTQDNINQGPFGPDYVVSDSLDANEQSLTFNKNVDGTSNVLTINKGASITNIKNLTIKYGFLHNNGSLSISEKLFLGQVNGGTPITNNGSISTGSIQFGDVGHQAFNFANNGTLTVTDGLIKGKLHHFTNNGVLTVEQDTVTFDAEITNVNFGKDATLAGAEDQSVSLVVQGKTFKNESVNLEINDFEGRIVQNNGKMNVLGNFTASTLEGDSTSTQDASITVKDEAKIKFITGNARGALEAETLRIEEAADSHLHTIKAEDLIVERSASFKDLETLNVDNLVVHEATNGVGYAAFGFADNVAEEDRVVNLKSATFDGKGYRSGIQLMNANLKAEKVVIDGNTNGMIDFNEGSGYTAEIDNLEVKNEGTLWLTSKEKDNQTTVTSATFGDNSKIALGNYNKIDSNGNVTEEVASSSASLSLGQVVAQGQLTIGDLGEGSRLEIQKLSGVSSTITVNEGATVAISGLETESFNIDLKTLAKGAVSVASVADNTKTHVAVDGSLNTKDASKVIDAMNSAVQLGGKDFEYVIAEGDLFGAINGKGDNYTQAENTKLTALGSVTALSALTLRHEMNSLSKRMGELRDAPAGVGAWVRGYGSEMEYGTQNIKAKNNSIQMGSDYTVGDWKVGAAFTYTDGESSYDNGSADNKGYGVAVYGTWFVPCGAYVDLMAKYNRLDNDFALNGMDGSYNANAYGVSAETGYRFNFMDGGVYVEPQVGIAYSRMTGETFTASNDVTVEQDDYDSLIGRVGVRTGFKFPKDKGTIYARVSGVYDFQGEVKGIATKNSSMNTIEEDLGGAWLEMGVGANFNWTKNTYTYIDLERTNGGEVKENYRWNIGLRHTF